MLLKSSCWIWGACLSLLVLSSVSEAKSLHRAHNKIVKKSYNNSELYSDNADTHRSFLDPGVMVPEWKGHNVVQQMVLHNKQSLQVSSPGVLWRESGLPGYHEAENGLNSFSWSFE